MNLKQKKLLILGGITHMLDVVREAQIMGLYTIVCDYSPSSPAKKIAHRAYDVSTTDIDALEEISKKECVDAVFAGFEDLNTWNASNLCRRLNLPFYATVEQLKITSNKSLFKEFCRDSNIPVVPEYSLESLEDIKFVSPSVFPVIVKPVDSYGSRGISICKNLEELKDAYAKALSFSKEKRVVVEHFATGYGVEMYYTVIDGVPYLSAMADRYVITQAGGGPPLPTATVFPSKHLKSYCIRMNEEVKNLIRHMNIKHGVLLFQGVLENDIIYIYEMAYRLTGEQHYHIVQKETGINLLKLMIDLTLGNDIRSYEINQYDENCLPTPACNLAVLLKPGIIGKVNGLELILAIPDVISHVQTLFAGDEITQIGNYGQIFIRFNIVSAHQSRLRDVIDFINEHLEVISSNGESLILSKFPVENLC